MEEILNAYGKQIEEWKRGREHVTYYLINVTPFPSDRIARVGHITAGHLPNQKAGH